MNIKRKWFGLFFLFLEMNLLGGTIFGFPAIFKVLSSNGIYQNLCQSQNECGKQIKEYQVFYLTILRVSLFFSFLFFSLKNAMTLGIAFFDLPALFIGLIIDHFGCRTIKLISM
jgi:hypothetical protein